MGCCSSTSNPKVHKPQANSPLNNRPQQKSDPAQSTNPTASTQKNNGAIAEKNSNAISSNDNAKLDTPNASARGISNLPNLNIIGNNPNANPNSTEQDNNMGKTKQTKTLGSQDAGGHKPEFLDGSKVAYSKEVDSHFEESKQPTKMKTTASGQPEGNIGKNGKTQGADNQNKDVNSKAIKSALDGYEAVFQEEKDDIIDQYLCEMNELQLKKYEEFLESDKDQKEELPSIGGSKAASSMMEWIKVLQKLPNINDKSTMNTNESNKGKLEKLYEMIVNLKARNWYEELVSLYKEKNTGTKTMVNMSSLTFDRKITMLQEHFRWLVSSVANTRLNFNKVVGSIEFPPIRLRSNPNIEPNYFIFDIIDSSGSNSESNSEGLAPSKSNSVSQGNTFFKLNPSTATYEFDSSSGNIYAKVLPEATSNIWVKGFLWKGVYFKLYSKKEGQILKREMRALKHIVIEYLQTETCFRLVEGLGSTIGMNIVGINESLSQDLNKTANQTLQVIPPLISLVESSSWILLGTPIFSRKKGGIEESLSKILNAESSGFFKNSFLLSRADLKNFKLYIKNDEQNLGQAHTLSASILGQQSTNYLLLSNANRLVFQLPKVQTLFMIAQDENVNIMFTEFPKKGYLDYTQIKKMLGYSKHDINLTNLKRRKIANIRDEPQNQKKEEIPEPYIFELVKFRKRGWDFQMIYIDPREKSKNFITNNRATVLLAKSDRLITKEIRGNVLVFAQYSNTESIIHPYFISENYYQTVSADNPADFNSNISDFNDSSRVRQGIKTDPNLKQNNNSMMGQNRNMKTIPVQDNRKDSNQMNASFCLPRISKDEKHFVDYFAHHLTRSIDSICTDLKKSDKIVSFNCLKDTFHRRGVNMRFAWLVYARVTRKSIRELLGIDLLVRSIKKILTSATSRRMKQFKNSNTKTLDVPSKRDWSNDIMADKNGFFTEEYFKVLLTHYINLLTRGYSDGDVLESNKSFYTRLTTALFLSRLRTIDASLRFLESDEFEFLMSSDTLKDIVNYAYYSPNILFDAIQHHFNLSTNHEMLRQLRNDKFAFIVTPSSVPPMKHTDLNIVFRCDPYLTIQEKCFVSFLKHNPNLGNSPTNQTFIEYPLPSSLYKLHSHARTDNSENLVNYDCYLKDSYEIPDLEVLNDWVVLLEGMLNGIVALNSEQNFLLEVYILQIMLTFFMVSDDQSCSGILDKINSYMNCASLCSPEMTVVVHTWYGILTETKHFVECEQSYMVALLTLHKLYGDPRARGGRGTPWELFITSRLSILSRLQGKTHDAEYVEELFDATLMSLSENKLNRFISTNHIYNEPFRDFLPKDELSRLRVKPKGNANTKAATTASIFKNEGPDFSCFERTDDKIIGPHPFVYWTHNLQYDENSFKIDVINQTLPRSIEILKWMVEYMPLNLSCGVVWEVSYLRDFFLSIMQNAYNSNTSVSSLSDYSVGRQGSSVKDKGVESFGGVSTPKNTGIKYEKKTKKYNQGGNLVQVFEKDASTLNKRGSVGVVYAWGQNSDGQVGIPTNFAEEDDSPDARKMRIYYPKKILSLKDTVIISVICGHTHSVAITISRRLLAWGNNKSGQLGLGKKAPAKIFVPAVVPDIEDVNQVSCGSEHTVALTLQGKVYSWGQGEGGLLGHENTISYLSPKKIEALDPYSISSVVCGGLHTLATTRQGHVYAWGRGEGGQLGIPSDQLTYDSNTNDLYLTVPKRVRGALEGLFVTQVACGDAHSLALTSLGLVYAWGYTNSGQLGLGVSQDNYEPGVSKYNLQVPEPVLIEKIRSVKITEIFAGSTFSLFMNEKRELFGCGINDFSQLGIEKAVTKITNTDNIRGGLNSTKSNEIAFPRKLECFTMIPIMKVSCGENHSLALASVDKYQMLFSWGMQRNAQLGLGDISANQFTPRPISYLQDIVTASMGCGAYHSLVVIGDPLKVFQQDTFVDRCKSKLENGWNVLYVDPRQQIENFFESALNDMEYTAPSDEGRIDNPKSIKKLM